MQPHSIRTLLLLSKDRYGMDPLFKPHPKPHMDLIQTRRCQHHPHSNVDLLNHQPTHTHTHAMKPCIRMKPNRAPSLGMSLQAWRGSTSWPCQAPDSPSLSVPRPPRGRIRLLASLQQVWPCKDPQGGVKGRSLRSCWELLPRPSGLMVWGVSGSVWDIARDAMTSRKICIMGT